MSNKEVVDDEYVVVTVSSPSGGRYVSVVADHEMDAYRAEASRLGFEILETAPYESKGGLPMCYWPSGILLFEKATRRILIAEHKRMLAERNRVGQKDDRDHTSHRRLN